MTRLVTGIARDLDVSPADLLFAALSGVVVLPLVLAVLVVWLTTGAWL